MESKFRFKSGVNLVDSEKASHGQLAILAPYGGNVFSEIVKCEDGTVTFTLTKEMIDQLEEVGLYSFQIRLFDYYRESRVSIPPVEFGIEVREPVASEDHDNSVNNAIVGYSIAKVVNPKEENVGDTFDANGKYNKTDWKTGDRISEGKLNKIEDAIDKINQNEKNDAKALDKRVTNNFNVLNSKLDNKMNKGDSISVGQINKNAGKLDQTYMSDAFLQQIAGNAPINTVPADKSITIDKLVDELANPIRKIEGKIEGGTNILLQSSMFMIGSPSSNPTWTKSTDYKRVMIINPIDISYIPFNENIRVDWNEGVYLCSLMQIDKNGRIIDTTRTNWQSKSLDIVKHVDGYTLGVVVRRADDTVIEPSAVDEAHIIISSYGWSLESRIEQLEEMSIPKVYIDTGVWENKSQGATGPWNNYAVTEYRLRTANLIKKEPGVNYELSWNDELYNMSYRTFDANMGDVYTSSWTLYNSPCIINDEGSFIGLTVCVKGSENYTGDTISVADLEFMNVELNRIQKFNDAYQDIQLQLETIKNSIGSVSPYISLGTWENRTQNSKSNSWYINTEYATNRLQTVNVVRKEPNVRYELSWNDTDYVASYRTFNDKGFVTSSGWTLPVSPHIIDDDGDLIGFVFAKKDRVSGISTSDLYDMNVKFKKEGTNEIE
jgi:hypothetical protein